MTDSTRANDGQPHQQVNLQKIAHQFMGGLQRHFDMLAFNLAARESVDEAAYNRRVRDPKIMPAGPQHMNFEQMQAYAQDLLMRQVIGDCMNLAVTGMNNAHFFLALIQETKADSQVSADAQKKVQEVQQAFVSAPLDQKFNKLETEYGILCELEDTIVSLGFCLQALMHQGGEVKAAQVGENGELAVELKVFKLSGHASDGEKVQGKLVDQAKVFPEGEFVSFSDAELQFVLVTVASFAGALFKSVAQYAKSVEEGGS